MNTPFIYKNKEYSLQAVLLYLLRHGIKNYGKALSGIILSCCPESNVTSTTYPDYQDNNSTWSKTRTLAKEISYIQNEFYFDKFKNDEDTLSIHEKLKKSNGKTYCIYNYFDLNGMYGYYLLTKSIVEQYNMESQNAQLANVTQEQREYILFDIYRNIRDARLKEIKEKFPHKSIHSDLQQSTVDTKNDFQAKVEAMYEWLGIQDHHDILPFIVDIYRENPSISYDELQIKINKFLKTQQILQNDDDKKHTIDKLPTFYNKDGECLGTGEPCYDQVNGEQVLTGYMTSDGDFIPTDL